LPSAFAPSFEQHDFPSAFASFEQLSAFFSVPTEPSALAPSFEQQDLPSAAAEQPTLASDFAAASVFTSAFATVSFLAFALAGFCSVCAETETEKKTAITTNTNNFFIVSYFIVELICSSRKQK
jgi:hypothetical protein